jgi:putative transcriptional regulator
MNNRETQNVGDEIISGLTELRDALRAGEPLGKRFTTRQVELELEPREFTAEQVRELRELFHASQAVFAHLIGISPATLQKWEQGRQKPPAWGRRLLELMAADQQPFRKMLEEGLRRKIANST